MKEFCFSNLTISINFEVGNIVRNVLYPYPPPQKKPPPLLRENLSSYAWRWQHPRWMIAEACC